MGKMRPNRRIQTCASCGSNVEAEQGYLVKSTRACDMGQWLVYHPDCAPETIRTEARTLERKDLTAEGNILHPYDERVISKLRALPGAWWNHEKKWWVVSLEAEDRARILAVANELGLVIAPELLEDTTSELAKQAERRAQFYDLPEIQVDATRWLSIRTKGVMNLAHEPSITATILASELNTPVIVVAKDTVGEVWERAFKTLRPKYKVKHRRNGKDEWPWPEPGEVYITTFGRLPSAFAPQVIGVADNGEEIKAVNFLPSTQRKAARCLLIVDDLDNITNYKAKASQRISGLVGQVKAKWYVGHLPTDPGKLWDALTVMHLGRETFGSFKHFKRCFNGEAGRFGQMTWGNVETEALDRL